MRSLFTILLAAVTAALAYIFLEQMQGNDLLKQQEQTTIEPDTRLFPLESVESATSIIIKAPSTPEHRFEFDSHSRWQVTTPYQDRADGPYSLSTLLNFITHTEVVQQLPATKKNLQNFGFDSAPITIELKDKNDQSITSLQLAKPSAWVKQVTKKDDKMQEKRIDVPTLYLLRTMPDGKQQLFLTTDPTERVLSLFQNQLKGFRDHRPFALNLHFIEQVSIKSRGREIIVDRSNAKMPWRILKPIDLATDANAIKELLVGISKLEATKLQPTKSVTLPENNRQSTTISINYFGVEEPVTLTIHPRRDDSQSSCYATVSDRDVVFELPIRPTRAITSTFTSLPMSVNQLRKKTMMRINPKNLRGFVITPRNKDQIVVAAAKVGRPFMLWKKDGSKSAINDSALARLIQAVTRDKVKSFVDDAVTDLAEYDLDRPALVVTYRPYVGKAQHLLFSRQGNRCFAHYAGTRFVWEVDAATYSKIPQHEWELLPLKIWDIPSRDMTKVSIHAAGKPPIHLSYDYFGDRYTASVNGVDQSPQLNKILADFLLKQLGKISAHTLLGPQNEAAERALAHPQLQFHITFQRYNKAAQAGLKQEVILTIASNSGSLGDAQFYFAKSSESENYFLLTKEQLTPLLTDIFSDD